MRFSDLFSRADDQTLQEIIGVKALRVLAALDTSLTSPTNLRALISASRSPIELLRQREIRRALLLLLRRGEAASLVDLLGLLKRNDPYAELTAAPIPKGSSREAKLATFFELTVPTPQADAPSPSNETRVARYPLFEHQRRASRQVITALRRDPRRVLLHMPTGSGKTRTAMHVVADHLGREEPTAVLWLAFSEELCSQAASEFEIAWGNIGNRELQLVRYWGGHERPEAAALRDCFIVASLQKIYRSAITNLDVVSEIAGRCSLIVFDEAHQAVAKTYGLIVEAVLNAGRTSALLGLSATPGRTWDDRIEDAALADRFGGHKVTLQIPGFASPIEYLTAEGYLAAPSFRTLLVNSGIRLSEADRRRLEEELDVTPAILNRLGDDELRNLALVTEVEQLLARHKRILVFAPSVAGAELTATVLQARGVNAVVISAGTEASAREAIIARYRTRTADPMVLCNFGVLTTGFDAPETSAALIARPTKSLVLYSQMIGRAIRGPRVGGNKKAEIVTVVDPALPAFGNVSEAFSNWDDVWRTE